MIPISLWTWTRRATGGLLAGALVACGGGGGSSGTGAFGTETPPVTPTTTPTLVVSIVDANDSAIAGNAIGNNSYVKAVLRTGAGVAISNRLVTFTTASTTATLAQPSALTNDAGVAKTKITPAILSAATAGSITATATVDGATVTGAVDYQAAASNVSLSQFTTGASSISALQSTPVQVRALVNGAAAAAGQVVVNFTASCGSFTPAQAGAAADGTVQSVYQSTSACSGPVTLTAQAAGSQAVTTTINVVAARAANLLFSSTDAQLLYTSRAASGVKQATLSFKVVNSANEGMASQEVLFNLSTTAINAGVTFAGGATTTQRVSTDASGIAKVTVVAGALPTPVLVTAALASDSSLVASSLTLAVTSGVPAQDKASLALEKMSIEGFNIDGASTKVSFRISDRQSNPVPQGTAVSLVAAAGTITGSCVTDENSTCSVTYVSSGTRPPNGRVAILAYLDGEEGFIDTNGNNYYDAADASATRDVASRFDVGMAFRDDNEDGVRQSSEQTFPGGTLGTAVCPYTPLIVGGALLNQPTTPSVQNTCDGTWTSNIRVRQQAIVVLATSQALIKLPSPRTVNGFDVVVSDLNGNSLPTGSTVSAALVTTGGTNECKLVSTTPGLVGNTTYPTTHHILLNGDPACAGTTVSVTVTAPSGYATARQF